MNISSSLTAKLQDNFDATLNQQGSEIGILDWNWIFQCPKLCKRKLLGSPFISRDKDIDPISTSPQTKEISSKQNSISIIASNKIMPILNINLVAIEQTAMNSNVQNSKGYWLVEFYGNHHPQWGPTNYPLKWGRCPHHTSYGGWYSKSSTILEQHTAIIRVE